MEAIIFMGIQGAGKSTFYRERFADTHLRINLDMLRTRHREKHLIETCLDVKQRFVVDNTNPARIDRARYISMCHSAQFRIVGYYFRSQVAECHARNEGRSERQRVPIGAVYGCAGRLEMPGRDEGFDELYYVRIVDDGFEVKEWDDAV